MNPKSYFALAALFALTAPGTLAAAQNVPAAAQSKITTPDPAKAAPNAKADATAVESDQCATAHADRKEMRQRFHEAEMEDAKAGDWAQYLSANPNLPSGDVQLVRAKIDAARAAAKTDRDAAYKLEDAAKSIEASAHCKGESL